jgi:ABC-type multidrug transport system permease subunit
MNAIIIALNGLKLAVRQREALFWIFIGPLIFTTFFGILFKAQPPRPPTLDIVSEDRTAAVANDVASALQRDGIVVTRVTSVTEGRLTLVVPAGASDALAAHKKFDLTLHAGAEETPAERDLRFKIIKAVVAITLGLNATDPPGPLTVVKADLGVKTRDVTAGFQRTVPSYMIMFVFLNLLVSGVGIAEERRRGLLRRLGMAPLTKREIVLGKLFGRVIIGWIQIAWMLFIGRVVFQIQWAEHEWVLFGFLSLFALASASLGILFGTLFRDPDKCRGIAIWTAILLAPLGGLWWPIEIVGPTMRRISYIVPTGWAMEPVNAMLAFGAGAREVAPFAAAFLALFAVTFTVASRRLDLA